MCVTRVGGALALLLASASPVGAVNGGAPDTDHPATAALVTVSPLCGAQGPPPETYCSGTLIAPRVVVTAAHCFDAAQVVSTRVVFGSSIDDPAPGGTAQPVAVFIHPGYHNGVDDLALVVLDAAVDVAAVSLASLALGATDVGRTVIVVGYGLDAPGPGGTTGARRSGTATITAVAADTFDIVAAPAMSCDGDSGGPVLLDGAGSAVLAGITSTGGATCEAGTNMRVDAYRGWIDPIVADVQANPPAARPPLDLAADYCASSCASDSDCPATMACVTGGDGSGHCALAGFGPGSFGDACAESCPSGACAATADGCRCWVPCATDPSGCGCGAGGAGQRATGAAWSLWVLGGLVWRRRRRRFRTA